MKLLLKREQTTGKVGGVQFKLWAKIEVDEDEQALVKRYKIDDSVLIFGPETKLIRVSAFLGFLAALVAYFIVGIILPSGLAMALGVVVWAGVGYWYYNEKREKLFVKDLLHGRAFTCPGIIELAKKEAWLENMAVVIRQVIETSKQWGGTQVNDVPALPPEEAKRAVVSFG